MSLPDIDLSNLTLSEDDTSLGNGSSPVGGNLTEEEVYVCNGATEEEMIFYEKLSYYLEGIGQVSYST